MRKYRLHWTINPDMSVEWYELQKTRMTEDAVARELDINYALSVSDRVFHEFDPNRHRVNEMPQLNRRSTIYRIWDFGKLNCVLYVYIDFAGRKWFLHERVLGKAKDGDEASSTAEQIDAAITDSMELFDGFTFYDICDPAGSYDDHKGAAPDVLQMEQSLGEMPDYSFYDGLPKTVLKKRGRDLAKIDMQKSPGGKEAFNVVLSRDETQGCPTLYRALLGGYHYKKDIHGNVTDRISEKHPYEDVIDCMIYMYLAAGNQGHFGEDTSGYAITSHGGYKSKYLGY